MFVDLILLRVEGVSGHQDEQDPFETIPSSYKL